MNLDNLGERLTVCPGECGERLRRSTGPKWDVIWCNIAARTVYDAPLSICKLHYFEVYICKETNQKTLTKLDWGKEAYLCKTEAHYRIIQVIFKGTDNLSGDYLSIKLKENHARLANLL